MEQHQKLNRLAVVAAKIAEVFHWVAVALLTASLAVYLFHREGLLKYFLDLGAGEFSVAGFSVRVTEDGALLPGAFLPALLAGIVVCGLMAMIFRNIYLIFKTSEGKTWFSKGPTPFQKDNVRMLREIGIFAISIPLWELACSFLVTLLVGSDTAEASVSLTGLTFGVAALCLSQFFAYGVRLQQDSDGLL